MKNLTFLISITVFSINLTFGQSIKVDTTHTYQTNSLALNLDGARHAYHPNNEGLLHNLNGGITKEEATTNKFTKKRGIIIPLHVKIKIFELPIKRSERIITPKVIKIDIFLSA